MNRFAPPCGRQPKWVKWTPSAPYPWVGGIQGGRIEGIARVGGNRFTDQQMIELHRLNLDPDTVPTMTVSRPAKADEVNLGPLSVIPTFEFLCPVVGKHKDGRPRVIAPAGMQKIVPVDGWVCRLPRDTQRRAYSSGVSK